MLQPYLVEALPQLNTDSWQVFPDGRMQTTFHLRPNLTWHDGTPLSAADFVFGWRVYATPDMGLSRQPPFAAIEDVQAPDSRTVVVRWLRPYPDGGHMTGRDRSLAALPRHVLEAPFTASGSDAFVTLPYWAKEYIGLGPYRLANWEPGAFIEAEAFAGHTLGRPKIDRLKISFIGDVNTTLANMLAGELQLAFATALGTEQALTLQRAWEPRQAGTVIYQINTWRGGDIQYRQELTTPRALLDARVRKALAYAVDKQVVNDAVNHGLAVPADYILPPVGLWAEAVKRGAVKYPYQPRTSEQLMREAGFEKGSDGIYTNPTQGRMSFEVRTTGGNPTSANELAAVAAGWQSVGFEISQNVVPPALAQDLETRAAYPGMYILQTPSVDRNAVSYTPDNIPTAENRWRGSNRSGWTHPEYVRLAGLFTSTLDPSQRADQVVQMARIYGEEVAGVSLYFMPAAWAAVSALTGLKDAPPETNLLWNIQDWELR